MSKSILFSFRHAPYGTVLAREGLDALLAAAVYEQEVAALFLNDGVFQLLKEQKLDSSFGKNHGKMLSALPIYGIDRIYVHENSLALRGLSDKDLLLPAVVLSDTDTRKLLDSFDQILSF